MAGVPALNRVSVMWYGVSHVDHVVWVHEAVGLQRAGLARSLSFRAVRCAEQLLALRHALVVQQFLSFHHASCCPPGRDPAGLCPWGLSKACFTRVGCCNMMP